MKINKAVHGEVMVITIEEKEANLSNSEQFKTQVIQEIAAGRHRLIISFIHVEYLDSSFLGALVAILKALLPYEGRLVLSGMNGDIVNLFELTRLDKIFVLKENTDLALKEF